MRDDYKELVELSHLYISGKPTKEFRLNRPGACHKARWMAKIIYAIKMVLLADKIKKELATGALFAAGQLAKIQRFIHFCIFVYVSWWMAMACPVASAAPRNDMLLWNSCRQYVKVDSVCAIAATKALSRHLWYLTEELVLLSLFDDGVTEQENEQIKDRLKSLSIEV